MPLPSRPPVPPATRPAPLHVALLRGINVGGHRRVTMPALKAVLAGLDLQDARTHVQSGNVVFRAHCPDAGTLEGALADAFGFPVGVTLRTREEWLAARHGNPYHAQALADGTRVHLACLSGEPDAEGLASLLAVPRGPDDWTLSGRTLYLHLPNGMARTRLDHGTLERRLGVQVTVRNWRTVDALAALLGP